MIAPDRTRRDGLSDRLAAEADALDKAMADAVTKTPTPTIDVAATWLTRAANDSMLSIAIAGLLATACGPRGRRAALRGMTAVGVTSIVANLIVKPRFGRHRPARSTATPGRRARVPVTSSFPSGHTASAFAFAAGVTGDLPHLALPLYALATAVGYSRVHLGVHYPSDAMAGAVLGLAVGSVLRQTKLPVASG